LPSEKRNLLKNEENENGQKVLIAELN